MEMQHLSYNNFCSTVNFGVDDNIQVAMNLTPASYLACVYDREWYLASVV